jgi:hypothetical protein
VHLVAEEHSIDERELLISMYRDFNARRIGAVLARMSPTVEWPNGMEGGYVYGIDAVRSYWTRQFAAIDPHVEPLRVDRDDKGRFVVDVHQTVRSLDGKVLLDRIVHHAYRLREGLVERMDIE